MSRKLGTPSTSTKGGVGKADGNSNLSGSGGGCLDSAGAGGGGWALKATGADSAMVGREGVVEFLKLKKIACDDVETVENRQNLYIVVPVQ